MSRVPCHPSPLSRVAPAPTGHPGCGGQRPRLPHLLRGAWPSSAGSVPGADSARRGGTCPIAQLGLVCWVFRAAARAQLFFHLTQWPRVGCLLGPSVRALLTWAPTTGEVCQQERVTACNTSLIHEAACKRFISIDGLCYQARQFLQAPEASCSTTKKKPQYPRELGSGSEDRSETLPRKQHSQELRAKHVLVTCQAAAGGEGHRHLSSGVEPTRNSVARFLCGLPSLTVSGLCVPGAQERVFVQRGSLLQISGHALESGVTGRLGRGRQRRSSTCWELSGPVPPAGEWPGCQQPHLQGREGTAPWGRRLPS